MSSFGKEEKYDIKERVFDVHENNKGLPCPFAVAVNSRHGLCQEGGCERCQIYLDYLNRSKR